MKIWANTIVNNEENFLWFAVSSVINYVDKILIYDTGSTDKTVEVIKVLQEKYGAKIIFKEKGEVDANKFTKLRQEMLEESDCDWVLVLDGDEVWWKDSIKKAVEVIGKNGKNLDGIVVPMIVPVGDIFHLQDENAGKYEILGKKGHISLKLINRHIEGLHTGQPYGKEGYSDKENILIQQHKNLEFINSPMMHLTHLRRSSKKRKYNKFKYELGKKVNSDFKFPEVFINDYPDTISNPFQKISEGDLITARILTPLRKLKRKIK